MDDTCDITTAIEQVVVVVMVATVAVRTTVVTCGTQSHVVVVCVVRAGSLTHQVEDLDGALVRRLLYV